MIEIKGDSIIVPIIYSDEDHLFMDTDKIKEEFENFLTELESDEYE